MAVRFKPDSSVICDLASRLNLKFSLNCKLKASKHDSLVYVIIICVMGVSFQRLLAKMVSNFKRDHKVSYN